MQKGGPNNSDFLQNLFPPEIRSPVVSLQKFQKSEKMFLNQEECIET